MKEQEYFRELIRERAIDDTTVKANARAAAPRRRFVWRKALAIAAGAAAVLIATVFTIPSTRAEVLSWFRGASTPQDYLTTDPSERPAISEIDSLITSPESADGFRVLPIDRTDTNAVNSEGALKVSDFLHENCDIALGDAMFDGQYFYQTVRLNGLSGLYLLEHWTGGNQTGVQVDPYAVWGLYENGPDEEYLSGKRALYERPDGRVFYELKDGTRLGGMLDLSEALDPYYQALFEKGLLGENRPADAQEQIDRMNREYLEQNGLTAVAAIWTDRSILDYADADGNLTVNVSYLVDVVEEDRGDGVWVDATKLFEAQLGTITVNVRAYQNIEASAVTPGKAVAWGAETVAVSKTELDFGAPDDLYADDRVALSKYRVSTEGLSMAFESAEVDALGIRNLKIRITVPEAWTQGEREAFAASLSFTVLLNGESGQWNVNSCQCNVSEDGSLLFTAGELSEVPYDMLKSIRTISLIPKLRLLESIDVRDINNDSLGVLDPDYGETVWSNPGVCGWNHKHTLTEFPQYTVELNVK